MEEIYRNNDGTYKIVKTVAPSVSPDDLVLEKDTIISRISQITATKQSEMEAQVALITAKDSARLTEINSQLTTMQSLGATIKTPEVIRAEREDTAVVENPNVVENNEEITP